MARGALSCERGAALISAMMIVSVMAVVAMGVLDALRLSVRLSLNLEDREQANLYALGAEELAAARISDAWRIEQTRQPALDAMMGEPFLFPITEGQIRGVARDGANCLNVNSVVAADGEGGLQGDDAGRARLARLLDLLGVPPGESEAIAASIADWIDTDARPGLGGAEDSYYGSLPDPYRTGETFMADVSEIRQVRGVTPALADALAPFLCARPTDEPSVLNLNTLTLEQSPLLAAYLGEPYDTDRAARIFAARPVGGWRDVSTVFGLSLLQEPPIATEDQALYGLSSSVYDVALEVDYRETRVTLTTSLAVADGGRVSTLSRRYGVLQ